MSFRDTVRVIQSGQRRVKIFIDFWNVVINARKQTSFRIEIHWDKIADQLVGETWAGHGDETTGDLGGCYIFGSFSKSTPTEHAFVTDTLDKYGSKPGLYFEFKERVTKEASSKCKNCGAQVSRSSELGVDVLLAVEMIKHAAMRDHQFLALVSSDRDYLPLLSYLKDQGQRVLHVAPGVAHRDMRSLTWKQIDLTDRYIGLCSISHEDRIILSSPYRTERLQEATALLDTHGLAYRVIDISKADDIIDQDLDFLLRNQNLFFQKKDGPPGRLYSRQMLSGSLHEFRKAIAAGEVDGNLPHVIYNGQMEAFFSQQGWVRSGSLSSSNIWAELKK
jgi:uncharacterized LabA/DUF88 family protein